MQKLIHKFGRLLSLRKKPTDQNDPRYQTEILAVDPSTGAWTANVTCARPGHENAKLVTVYSLSTLFARSEKNNALVL